MFWAYHCLWLDRPDEDGPIPLKAAGYEFLAGSFFDLRPVRSECGEPGALAGPLCAVVVLQRFAADGTVDFAIARARGEEHHVAATVVPLDLLREIDGGVFNHAQGIQDRQNAGELDVLIAALEAGDGRRAYVGDGG